MQTGGGREEREREGQTFELKEKFGERDDGGRDQVRRTSHAGQNHSNILSQRLCRRRECETKLWANFSPTRNRCASSQCRITKLIKKKLSCIHLFVGLLPLLPLLKAQTGSCIHTFWAEAIATLCSVPHPHQQLKGHRSAFLISLLGTQDHLTSCGGHSEITCRSHDPLPQG